MGRTLKALSWTDFFKRLLKMNIHIIKKYLLIAMGTISLVLGTIGIFIPVLPTTPFLLLSSFCYLRSSERLYNWLINHKVFGSYIYCYMTYKAVPRNTRTGAICFLWSGLIISMLLVQSLHLRLFLTVVGIGVTIHLMSLKVLTNEEMNELKKSYDDGRILINK